MTAATGGKVGGFRYLMSRGKNEEEALSRFKRATEEHIVHSAKQQSHFLETVRGVQSIKLFGRQEERREDERLPRPTT